MSLQELPPSYQVSPTTANHKITSANSASDLFLFTQPTSTANPTTNSTNAPHGDIFSSLNYPLPQPIYARPLNSNFSASPVNNASIQAQLPSQILSSTPSTVPQQDWSAALNALVVNVTKVQENFDKVIRSIGDVNQRISNLEKLTRDILENQKNFEIELKKNESLKTIAPPSYNISGSSMYPTVGKTTPTIAAIPTKLQPVSVLNLAKTEISVDQIEADRLLAAKLQNEFNTKAIQQPSKTEPTSECPVCGSVYPVASIEQHVNTHFSNIDPEAMVTPGEPDKSHTTKDEPTLWNRLFGNNKKTAEIQKKDEVELKTKPSNPKPTNPINPLYPGFTGATYAPMTTPQYRYQPGTTALAGYPTGYPVNGQQLYPIYYSNPATN